MIEDRLAEQLRTALQERRPTPSRQLSERLESAARHPRPRRHTPVALALAVAAGVLLVIATWPGQRIEPDRSTVSPAGAVALTCLLYS
jgi:ferric-dicitrate binding protein FerR (iron transport regulator)